MVSARLLKETLFTDRSTGHIDTFEDLNTGTPSMLHARDIQAGGMLKVFECLGWQKQICSFSNSCASCSAMDKDKKVLDERCSSVMSSCALQSTHNRLFGNVSPTYVR
jgi:hypothetical protein